MVLGRIGLTGSTGLLGRHIKAALMIAGADIVCATKTGIDGTRLWNLEHWLTDVTFDEIFGEVSALVHVGARVTHSGAIEDSQIFDSNVRACLNLGQWALKRNIPVVHVSGAIVYANPWALVQKESSQTGWSGFGGFYGLSKLLAEDVFERLRQQGLQVCILRPTSIYGYGMSGDKLISRLLSSAYSDMILELSEPVDDCFDLIHATDVAIAVVSVLNKKSWETFNISSGNPVSFLSLAQCCVEVVGKGQISIVGSKPSLGYLPAVRYSLDNRYALDELGWKPIINLQLGLQMQFSKRTYLGT